MLSRITIKLLSCFGVVVSSMISVLPQNPLPQLPAKPKLVSTMLPKYPAIARAACAQGTVAILVEVDSEGKVKSTDTLYGHPLLKKIAETAAGDWRFEPTAENRGPRREVIRFAFQILPFEVSEKKLRPVWVTETEVQIRVHPFEPSCDDCSEKRRKELRRGGCP
jgi:TonB family protein